MKFSRAIRHLNMKDVNRKQLQKEKALKEGTLSEEPTMTTSNIYPETSEIPNQDLSNFEAIMTGGQRLGFSGADGNTAGNASLGDAGGFTDVALSPPHPVTGVRNSAAHVRDGTGGTTPLRPGKTTTRGFSDNPPVYTMGSCLWFYDSDFDNGAGQPAGKWCNLEFSNFEGETNGKWFFWDTIKPPSTLAGFYFANTDLSQHHCGDISDLIDDLNFPGIGGSLGAAKIPVLTVKGLETEPIYPGPIANLFGLGARAFDWMRGKAEDLADKFKDNFASNMEGVMDDLKDHWAQSWEDVKDFPDDLQKFGEDFMDMMDAVTDELPVFEYSKDIADSIFSNEPKDNSHTITNSDKESLYDNLNYDNIKVQDKNDGKENYYDNNIITNDEGDVVRPRHQWPTDENGDEIQPGSDAYKNMSAEQKAQVQAWASDNKNYPNNTAPVHSAESEADLKSSNGKTNPLAAAGQAQMQVYWSEEKGEWVFAYDDHAYVNQTSKDPNEIPGLGWLNPKAWMSSAIHFMSDKKHGRNSNSPNTGAMANYPSNIRGDSYRGFETPVSEMPIEFQNWFESQMNENNSIRLIGRKSLSEAVKLGHFEPDILDVDINDIRKGIMPEYPKQPPAEMIDGYHQKSPLRPKPLDNEPYVKITKVDLIRNHRIKPSEVDEMMDTINRLNDYIKKHPEDLIYAQQRYPKDDPRLAELNWKMDQMLEAGKDYLDKNFKENSKLFKRAIDRTKNNIKLTDPKYAQQRYDELRGTVKPKKTNLVGRLGKHLNKYESKGVLRHVDSDDFKKISERKLEKKKFLEKQEQERLDYINDINAEMDKFKSDWRKDISESDFTNITKGNKVGQTFQHTSGATITLDNTMSDPSDQPSQVTLDLGFGEKITVDAPSGNEYGIAGVTKPLDKKVMQKQSVKTAQEINDQIDASEKASESKSARVPIETGDLGYKSTDEILADVGDQWTYLEYMAMLDAIADKAAAAEEPIAKAIAEYSPTGSTPGDVPISLIDAQEAITNARNKAEQALHQAWERYNKVPEPSGYGTDPSRDTETEARPVGGDQGEEGISSDDIKFLNKQQTLVNLTKGLGAIGLPNDFAQWTINYAKGDMKPITKFSPGMERQVRNLVLDKFKKNPGATTVDIQYGDYGFGAKALSTRLGLGRFNATKLPNGKIRIQDTFNVDKDFTTIGFADIVPGLQKTADRLVDISYKTRNIKGRTDEGGIKIDVLIDSGFVKKKRGSAFNKIKKIRNK